MTENPAGSRIHCASRAGSADSAREAPGSRGHILVVDRDAEVRASLARLLRSEGFAVETAADEFKALPRLEPFAPELLLIDLMLPGMEGLRLLHRVKEVDPELAVVVMTGHATIDGAIAAMRQGAADYLCKPIHGDELVVVADRELDRRRLRREAGLLRQSVAERHRIDNIVGSSPLMLELFDTVLQVAPSRASVVITGESGTGKELVAAAIHEHSSRSRGPFVKLHCAALAETLLESELFGHEKGAYTGALARRDGRFRQAHGGTLFLDEIGDISPSIQIKLLRFLQDHEFQRVGGNETVKVDVRIIAATNRDLSELVASRRFREDLYYRLNVVTIHVPPLRSRPGDIRLLAMHFLRRYARENEKTVQGFSDEALHHLAHYPWRGNVRELENAVERAVVICRGSTITAADLSPTLAGPAPPAPLDGAPPIPGASLADLERYAIQRTLDYVRGSTSRAAAMLGISARKIQYRLREYAGAPRRRPTFATLRAPTPSSEATCAP